MDLWKKLFGKKESAGGVPPQDAGDNRIAKIDAARMLAAAIADDIALYNAEKLPPESRADVAAVLASEIEEGRKLFRARPIGV